VTVDGPQLDAWIKTVTHYYNGCTPTGCSVYDQRYQHYADNGADVFFEQGADFWVVDLPPCAPIPAEGRLLEETDTCFTKGGPLPFWRVGIGGESNLHVWTGTTDLGEAVNFAEWTLSFDEPGDYRLEVSVVDGTTPQAAYSIDHAGTTTEVVIDQSAADGFVELGVFPFDAGGSQRVFVGDNTGDTDDRKLAVDAIRLTRVGGEGGGPTGVGGLDANGAGGLGGQQGLGGASEGGAGGGGGEGLEANASCDCTVGPRAPHAGRSGGWALFAAFAGLAALRRNRRIRA
jgi:hypothetical protein